MAELALDDDQRDTLVSHLDRVRVPQLVRGEPTTNTGESGGPPELLASGRRLPASPGGCAVDYAEQSSDWQIGSDLEPWLQLIPGPAIHPDLAALAALPASYQDGAAQAVKIRLGKIQRLADPKPGAPQHHDQGAQPCAVRTVAGGAHDRDDLLDRRRIGRVADTLFLGARPW